MFWLSTSYHQSNKILYVNDPMFLKYLSITV